VSSQDIDKIIAIPMRIVRSQTETQNAIREMALLGFTGPTIARMLREWYDEDITINQVYYQAHKLGVRLREYRDGVSPRATKVLGIVSKNLDRAYRRRRRRKAS
jgi:hypothetical protein